METPPTAQQKALRSNSNEVRQHQIDFTEMARNRLQTYSTKKLQMTNPNITPVHAASTALAPLQQP
jgi:hypothetical protein